MKLITQTKAVNEAAEAWAKWTDCQTACRKAYYKAVAPCFSGSKASKQYKAYQLYNDAQLKRDAAYAYAMEAEEEVWRQIPRVD